MSTHRVLSSCPRTSIGHPRHENARFRGYADFTIRVLVQQAADAGGQIAPLQRSGVVGDADGHANSALVGESHVIDRQVGDHAG